MVNDEKREKNKVNKLLVVLVVFFLLLGSYNLFKVNKDVKNTETISFDSSIPINKVEVIQKTVSPRVSKKECVVNWECSEWSECGEFGDQARKCVDQNTCGYLKDKPIELQSCVYEVPEPEEIYLSGSGKEASKIFTLTKGASVFEMKSIGSRNFAIWLLDESGDRVDLLVNEIGSFDGSKMIYIENEGNYILDVTANDKWKVSIKQPRPTNAPEINIFSGKGKQYIGPFYLKSGLKRFTLKNKGNRNFAVWLLDKDGSYVELLANEIGSFDGSRAVGIDEEGIYFFDISSKGSWQITIE